MKVEYVCANCHGLFEQCWTDAEAEAEYKASFPKLTEAEPQATVCDDCYKKIMAYFEHAPGQPKEPKGDHMELGTPLTIIPDLTTEPTGQPRPDGPATITVIGGMPQGTKLGFPTVGMIVVDTETGRRLYCETTLKLFLAAADALRIRYARDLEG